jgi:hypothetical protein
VPDIPEIKGLILKEAHETPYSIHPGSTKMYMDLKELFWWNNMKRDIAKYVADVTPVKESRQSIKVQQGYFNLWTSRNGNGRKSEWTLLPGYL